MKKIAGPLLVLSFFFSACSAQTYRVQKAQAFFTSSMPGHVMTDEQGNRINPLPIIDRLIFLETNYPGRPAIDTVWYNDMVFLASVADKEETSMNIGVKKNNGLPVKLNPKKGNHIWRIGLQQTGVNTLSPEAVKKIRIRGKLGKTGFSNLLNTETELSAPDRY